LEIPTLDNAFQNYKPNQDVIHIIWNLLLTDKTTKLTPELIQQNNVAHIIAILPNQKIYSEMNPTLSISHSVIEYGDDHTEEISEEILELYQNESQKINSIAQSNIPNQPRKNVLVYCNNGYQRSLPFLCYYLNKEHPEEAPTLEKALDLVLPQVNRAAYLNEKDQYLDNLQRLDIW